MRVLFDHNVPRALRHRFVGHEVSTAAREGWDELANGRLLAAVESAGFELFVTRDRDFLDAGLLVGRSVSIALVVARDQGRAALEGVIDRLAAQLPEIAPGTLLVVEALTGGNPDAPRAVD